MNTTFRIFLVEDDPMYQRMVKYIIELNPDHEVHVFSTGQECIKHLNLMPDIISLDYTLPDMTGEEVLRKIKSFNELIGVIILSGQQDISTAVKLLREGAYDYITKDSETKDRLLNTLTHIKGQLQLRQEVDELRQELTSKYEFSKSIIGNSPAIQQVFQLMEKAIRTNITISITGETGVGKEVVAKSIHYNSGRRKGPFIAVNMGAIPKDLLESELFGHEKGAFTSANARKRGQFELSDKGTLFLDEIAEVGLSMQAKLLRVLQEREFIRVGGEKTIAFDSRIIIATHKDLAKEVQEGRFREDLYYRLLGLTIPVPPLRDRGNDVILLAESFLKAFSKQNGLSRVKISKAAKRKLLGYSFPGNIRELKAIIELAAVMADQEEIQDSDIQFQSIRKEAAFLNEELSLEDYKMRIIHYFLEKYNNDVLRTAQKLDIGKSTIYRLLKTGQEDAR